MWKDYSSGYIRNNRASSISVVVAAFISALFLSLLCCLFFNYWNYEVESVVLEEGDWHGRITGILDDNALLRGMMSVTFVTNSAGDYGFFSGESWHEQDYWYYCGPASVANALDIINGTSNSQSTYATYMGTTSSNGTAVHMVVSAMNNYQSTNSYGYRSIGTDYSRLWNPIITDTETNNVPCIVML